MEHNKEKLAEGTWARRAGDTGNLVLVQTDVEDNSTDVVILNQEAIAKLLAFVARGMRPEPPPCK